MAGNIDVIVWYPTTYEGGKFRIIRSGKSKLVGYYLCKDGSWESTASDESLFEKTVNITPEKIAAQRNLNIKRKR